ncbi:putative periplasmic serine endoprotease DegP-like precursor [Posidoniimonas corsicana]|uniref:Putative periplasmic serine endoprotease DegP-like n=1 Tax=Posidoniimonas corsicana TaxID=1938618 RepID=A0A5C5VDR7_9BACT|nr:S1C family serine protease [Posidoniimonas corsicana]TWT36143.1 putative periplasmic serine endoprotease DegP-like precursor [Posidoniimonas corsicana]
MYSNRFGARVCTSLAALLLLFVATNRTPAQPPAAEASPDAAAPPSSPAEGTEAPESEGAQQEGDSKAPDEQSAEQQPPPPSDAPQDDDQSTHETEDDSAAVETADQGEKGDAPEQPPVTRQAVPWTSEIEAVSKARSPKNLEDLRLIQKQVRSVVEYARPATVGVQVGGSIGSAVIVSEDGLALTAGHVAMEPNKRVVFLFADGRRARGITLGVNSSIDSGMMKITDKGPWPYVPMAPAGSISPGDWVVGLGQPNGFFRDRAPPVRLGRVLFQDDSTLCTDVTLVGGDSGGPLFNLKGQVVGIHSRIGRRIVSNYHVPIDQYHTTWDRLAGGQMWGGGLGASEPARHRAFLGVAGNSLRGPCRLTQVYEGLAAARAGLKEGDIVTRFDGEEVESFSQFGLLVGSQKPGAKVKVEVERDGKRLEFEVRLGIASVDFPGAPPLESDS